MILNVKINIWRSSDKAKLRLKASVRRGMIPPALMSHDLGATE